MNKKEKFDRYGWKCNETNLATLPDSAPQEAKDLTKWLTLEGRRSSLQEYIDCVGTDGRIHGKFWHIGAWTHRKSHSSPNQANIASVFEGTPTNPVEEIKAKYDGRIRHLFKGDQWLVGTDADGIQLRILAHLMKSPEYTEAILKGDKSKGTDIHSMNMKALGSVCKSRDVAKTFIYAFLLGAGVAKVAEILDCTIPQAKTAIDNFIESLPGLKRLKKIIIPRDAARGYFIGLDGRKVPCNSEHLMLAGYLQNGESVVMKWACLEWHRSLASTRIRYKMVDDVHDEWQTSVIGTVEEAKIVGEHQCKSIEKAGEHFGMFCSLAGTTKVGTSWRETH